MKKQSFFGVIVYLAILAALCGWLLGLFTGGRGDLTYSEVVELFQDEQVKSFTVQDDTIYLQLHSSYNGKTELAANLANSESFRAEMWELMQQQKEAGILESYDFIPDSAFNPMSLVVPMALAGLVVLIVWFLLMSKANQNNPMANFGKARTVLGLPDNKKVTFQDVAGADEEKQELQEVVDFLRNPEKYTKIGARIPHGLLLVGPPGTGAGQPRLPLL